MIRYFYLSYNRQTWFDPAAANPLSQATGLPFLGSIEFASNSGNPRQRWETDANNFGPRVGFAWQATQKTVVRGGYDLFPAHHSEDFHFRQPGLRRGQQVMWPRSMESLPWPASPTRFRSD